MFYIFQKSLKWFVLKYIYTNTCTLLLLYRSCLCHVNFSTTSKLAMTSKYDIKYGILRIAWVMVNGPFYAPVLEKCYPRPSDVYPFVYCANLNLLATITTACRHSIGIIFSLSRTLLDQKSYPSGWGFCHHHPEVTDSIIPTLPQKCEAHSNNVRKII